MGCDIHGMIERAQRGEYPDGEKWIDWRAAGEVDIGRNYEMFAALAGVRNSLNLIPVSEPKGLPGWDGVEPSGRWHNWGFRKDEPNVFFQAYYEHWHGDAHSASWLTLAELKAYDTTQEIDDPSVIVGRSEDGRVLATAGWSAAGGDPVGKRRIFVWPGEDESKPTAWDRFLADIERAKQDGDSDEDVRIVFFFDN
jgi:hypothetical protein